MNQTIGVNIVPQSPQPTLHYSQGDVGRVFVVNVTDYDIPAGATVTCVATKPSGMGFTVSGTVSGNSVTFTSTAEMTDEWGRFPAEIRIASGNTLLGTANFLMIGEKDPHPASTIDGTQEELIPQLTLLVNRVEAAAESVHDLTVSATTLAAGSDATATYDSANNSIAFGIPRGADGDVTRTEFNDLKSDSDDYRKTLQINSNRYITQTQAGWGNKAYFFQNASFPAKIKNYFSVTPTTASAYLYLYDDDADTEILHVQLQGDAEKTFIWTPTQDMSNVSCYVSTGTYVGILEMSWHNKMSDKLTKDDIRLNGVFNEVDNISLLRQSVFVRGSNYNTSFEDANEYVVSSENPITATDDWFISVDDGFQISLTITSEDNRYVSWKTKNYYVNKGTSFVIRICRNPAITSEKADVLEFVNHVRVVNPDKYDWELITQYSDSLEMKKQITLDGNLRSVDGTYWHLYTFKNPQFKHIRAHVSSLATDCYQIAFFNSEEISAESLISSNSVSIDPTGWAADVQSHYLYAEVPDGCKMVCVSSRNLLNDNSRFYIEIYADDASSLKGIHKPPFSHNILNGNKYVCHMFADKIGSGNYLIPCQSMAYIDTAHRLGYKMIELNVHPTATAGKYVCLHGRDGKIGDELIARNGDDISNTRFETVTYDTYLNDYIYNSTQEKYRTHITFLDEALRLCKQYNMLPILSFADLEMLDVAREIVGDNFVVLVYNDIHMDRGLFNGAYNRYSTTAATPSEVDELFKRVGAPILYGMDDVSARDLSTDELLSFADVVHKNGGYIGSCGVYQSAGTNLKLAKLGFDWNATGNEVEYFGSGNLLNLHDNENFEDFYTQGDVTSGVLHLTNGQYLSSALRESVFLSKAILQIRFVGELSITMGDYINNLTVESDGVNAIELSTFFINMPPNFTIQSIGNSTVYDCVYKASIC